MEPSNKKQRGAWTERQLKDALDAINKKKMSQRKAALTYNIPRRTLRNHINSGSTKKITGRTPILNELQEKDLCDRVIRLAQVGLPLTPKIVRKQAYEFCKSNNIPNSFNDKRNIAGKKWLKNFILRNPSISLRKAQLLNPARAQKLNKSIVQKHFDAIKKLYDELNLSTHSERLYNVDEKGCRLTLHHQQKVFAEKGTKRVHFVAQEHAENVTIAMCVNANGNTVPPMIIFKGKRLRPEYCDNLPPGSLVKMAPKGSMTTELFVDFIKHLSQYKSPGKCLLIFDGASSHLDARIVDAADAHDIVLYCLPSNTTHELQPLDKSVNKSYEHYWDEEVLLYSYQHPDRKLTKQRFNKIFSTVWSKCTRKENITSGFRAAGLFPYNPNAISEEAFAPSALTFVSDLQAPPRNVSRVHDLPSNLADLQASVFKGPVEYDNFDPNMTDCEELSRNSSPSVLTQYDLQEKDAGHQKILTTNLQCATYIGKLVDYSSSSESSIMDDQNKSHIERLPLLDRNLEFCSPVPTTSGINMQRQCRLNVLTSDESGEEDFETYFQNFQYPSKVHNIYSSSSESYEENGTTKNVSV